MRAPFVGFTLLVLASVGSLAAQVRGTVVDEQHRPLADAVVDLWSGTARLSREVTGADGTFRFDHVDGAERLLVRRIGSLATTVVLLPGRSTQEVVLVAAPVTVEPIDVDGGKCDRRTARAAEALWRRTADRYRPPDDSTRFGTVLKVSQERLPFTQVGRPLLDSTGYGVTRLAGYMWEPRMSAGFRTSAPFRVRDPLNVGDLLGLGPTWHAFWVAPEFIRAMDLSLVDDQTIRFCPKDRKHPALRGEMKVGEDGGILWVRWRHTMPTFDPEAGGTVQFIAPAADSSWPLMPSEQTIWQSLTSGNASQGTTEYKLWLSAGSDSAIKALVGHGL